MRQDTGYRQSALYPDCLMSKRRTDTRRHISHSCHLVSIQLPPHWKLSWHWCSLCFHRKQREARLSRCYQGTKVKPFDCSVIALTVYLPGVASPLSIHTYSPLPRNKRLSLESRANRWEQHQFLKVWIPTLVGFSPSLSLSKTADRPAQWVWWQKANPISLILRDEANHQLHPKFEGK